MESIKIGIITQITFDSVNFGNYLQAYALNKYINSQHDTIYAETLLLKDDTGLRYTSFKGWFRHNYLKKKRAAYRFIFGIKKIDERYTRFRQFAVDNIILSKEQVTMSEIDSQKYDALIVGSDVVWYQIPGVIDLPKLLPFYKNTKKRYSYAASFGNNHIPTENIEIVKKYISGFDKISVRESTAMEMLFDMGIKGVTHTCDPTMLLSDKEWRSISKKPYIIEKNKVDDYVFAYFLGDSDRQINIIRKYFENKKTTVLYIPHVNGMMKRKRENNCDLIDCSPEEWLWLVDNAQYVITDSFHGLVFSIIFRKKFVTLQRVFLENINSRSRDLLSTISAEDKMIKIDELNIVENMKWDNDNYIKRIQGMIDKSEDYIREMIGEIQ